MELTEEFPKGAIQVSLPEPGAAEDVSGDQKGLVIVAVSFPARLQPFRYIRGNYLNRPKLITGSSVSDCGAAVRQLRI